MIRKYFKNYISFLICVAIFTSYLPLNIIYANLQSHVRNLSLQNVPSESNSSYTINFNWSNPSWSETPDGEYDSKDEPEGFKLQYLNATARETNFQDIEEVKKKDATSITTNRTLDSGSIYEFKVTPYHYHRTEDNKNVLAAYENNDLQETVLFMTDIQIEAEGRGNTLDVTFDNPQYKGTDIFDGFRIYYQKGGSQVTSFNNYKDISINDEQIVKTLDPNRKGVQRLTYSITDNNIQQGSVYALKVEPLYNGDEIRNVGELTYKTISLGNQYKKISFKLKSQKEYRTNNSHIAIPLEVTEDGKDYLKLNWWGINNNSGTVEKIEVYSGDDENNVNKKLGVIYSSEAIYVNSWRVEKPNKKTYYKILVYIENKETPINSAIAYYDPVVVNVTPNKPNIYLENSINNNSLGIDIYWDVFSRYPYTQAEEKFAEPDGTYIDTDVNYDIWITDDIENLENINLPRILSNVSAKELTKVNIEQAKNSVYKYSTYEYVHVDENGKFINKNIEENKTYYVKVIARKHIQGSLSLSSKESLSQIYVPLKGNISTPQVLSKPPLKVKVNEKGEKEITQTDINIFWYTKWFEVYDQNTKEWHSEVAIRNGKLIFGKDILETDLLIDFYSKENKENVIKSFVEAGLNYEEARNLTFRQIDLSAEDINYELKVVDFKTIESIGGYEEYIDEILKNPDLVTWTKITPDLEKDLNAATYKVSNLEANKLYAILLKPYRLVGGNKKEAKPNYVIQATLPNETEVDVKPITPQLFEDSVTDISTTVKWEYVSGSLKYELAVDENIISDPSKGSIFISSDKINEEGTLYNENELTYIKYDIQGLFPDTGYYVYIRVSTENGNTSEWSNPLYVRTNEIKKPEAPSGFGLASKSSIETYNSNNNTEYTQSSENYIIVEWIRDSDDTEKEIPNFSDGNAELMITNNHIHSHMLMFKNLISNKKYYFRLKTKLTIAKQNIGIKKYYTYIVEASLNKDFKDSIKVELPTFKMDGTRTLTIESEWTPIYSLDTMFSKEDNEFDSSKNDNMYPLPTEDFEIIYETSTKTLVYRFRTNKKDEQGNQDNLVDQRFISKLLENKTFKYNLDLTNHKGYDISNRRIEIPYTVFKAFEERKISLGLTVDGSTFVLNPKFLNTSEVKSQNLNYDTIVTISLEKSIQDLPYLSYGQMYTTSPQKIRIFVSNNFDKKELSYTGSSMDISLKLKNRYLKESTNVNSYIKTNETSYWQAIKGNYNKDEGSIELKSNRLATYSTISSDIVSVANNSSSSLYDFGNKIFILDIGNIDLDKNISSVQFNNLVSAVANNKQETFINTALSTNDYNSLRKSNLILEGAVVTREVGISALVRLYEIKTKRIYKNYTNINNTNISDIKNANKAYQSNLLKASELGFFENESLSRPKDFMTIQEVLYILNIILEDSGL